MNKVVARFADGRIVKGVTADFTPGKDSFHVTDPASLAGSKPVEIHTKDLKALFFVKDPAGNPAHSERKEFEPGRAAVGRRIRVEFRDGEVLLGTTQGYQPSRPGFFVIPADEKSNNERCYIVSAATRKVSVV